MTDRLPSFPRSPGYDDLCVRLRCVLDGNDRHLPLPRPFDLERNEQRVVIAVCEATGMTPEYWHRLDVFSRQPWLEKVIAHLTNGRRLGRGGARQPPSPDRRRQAEPNNGKKQINARMLKMIQEKEICCGWTCTEWAKALKCSTASVVSQPTWKTLKEYRSAEQATRAADRRRGRTGGRTR